MDRSFILLKKADQDTAAFHVLRIHQNIEIETICFHAQQAVEKYFKAVLASRNISFWKTHDLDVLVDLILDHHIPFPFDTNGFSVLTPFAVLWRYEDMEVDGVSLETIQQILENVRIWAWQTCRS